MTRILIFNFFGDVMDRGIPVYARDIAEAMRRSGYEPIEIRCPKIFQRAPRAARNLLFVLFEQIVAPAARVLRGCSVTVYPYNSVGALDAALGRSILVIHDLISNHKSNKTLAARYIRVTQSAQRLFARPICAASEHTLVQLQRLDAFEGCRLHLWSNPFYTFEEALARSEHVGPIRRKGGLRVLLCSGMGANKDYGGALRLFAQSDRLRNAQLRVLGFGDDAALARRRVSRLPASVRDRVVILPRLSLSEVVSEYLGSELVWVHSRKEGFGRSVVEARLSGRTVVASSIPAFSRLAGPGIYLYRPATFDADIANALEHKASRSCLSASKYHARLEAAVQEVVSGDIASSPPQLISEQVNFPNGRKRQVLTAIPRPLTDSEPSDDTRVVPAPAGHIDPPAAG